MVLIGAYFNGFFEYLKQGKVATKEVEEKDEKVPEKKPKGIAIFFTSLLPYKFLYNIIQVMLCSYMCIEAGLQAYKHDYTLLPCIAINYKNPPIGPVLYIFYLSKVLDFADTFFIIVERRWQQLSFLHVYHHFTIFMFYWLNVNVAFDGDVYLTIVLNGFIHTIMYTYYFVSLHTKSIPWKSLLTSSQLVQFVIMNAQALFILGSDCKAFPQNVSIAYFVYIVSLILLFSKFFYDSYISGKGGKSGKTSSTKKTK
jgi:elongation of very long chain fatty acids protein 4